MEQSYPFSGVENLSEKCLTDWLNPLPRGEKGDCLDEIGLDDFSETVTKNGADKFQTLIDNLENEKLEKLSKLISKITKSFLT